MYQPGKCSYSYFSKALKFYLRVLFPCDPLGKITSRVRPEYIPEKRPDVLRTSLCGPICNGKGRIFSGTSLGRTQDGTSI